MVVEELAVHVALQKAGCIVCRTAEQSSTYLRWVFTYVIEPVDVEMAFELSLIT